MSSTNDQQGMAQMNNIVQIRIDDRIQGPAKPSSWPKIFQVPHHLRRLNEEAYEPNIISIGPYNRQKDHLKAMETHKERFLNDLLQRRHENSAKRYVDLMSNLMERARNYYSESLDISHEEFLEMMVLDGCFIVELIHKIDDGGGQHDAILNVSQISDNIWDDLSLVENQLPFFVLWELFLEVIIKDPGRYTVIILKMFEEKMPGLRVCKTYNGNSMNNIKHLVDLLRINWLPSEGFMDEYKKKKYVPKKKREGERRCTKRTNKEVKENGNWSFIPSATELREAGIKFKRVDIKFERGSLFDIKFANGKLYIPVVTIHDGTERLFRNIIVCEQFNDSGSPKYLTEYSEVMDCLINTGKDVELLCRKRIIDNWLGTNEAVAEVFNTVGTEVMLNKKNFFYAKLFDDVNTHYYTRCNKRMASLRHNYFNTPWALISLLAAAFLLLLTFLQTTFTIFPRS